MKLLAFQNLQPFTLPQGRKSDLIQQGLLGEETAKVPPGLFLFSLLGTSCPLDAGSTLLLQGQPSLVGGRTGLLRYRAID